LVSRTISMSVAPYFFVASMVSGRLSRCSSFGSAGDELPGIGVAGTEQRDGPGLWQSHIGLERVSAACERRAREMRYRRTRHLPAAAGHETR